MNKVLSGLPDTALVFFITRHVSRMARRRWLRVLSVRPGRSFRAGISGCCDDFLTADRGQAGLGSGADSAGIGAGLEQAAA